jgi:hypothetical protein
MVARKCIASTHNVFQSPQQLDSGIPVLPSQQQAILAFQVAESAWRAADTKLEEAAANTISEPPSQATTPDIIQWSSSFYCLFK